MTTGLGKPRKILVVADTGEVQIALESALTFAELWGASLEVIACVEPPHDLSILSRLSGANADSLVKETHELTRKAVAARLAATAPDRKVDLSVAMGKSYLEIIRHVARSQCDFVIKTAEPLSGIDRFLFASTDQHLLR